VDKTVTAQTIYTLAESNITISSPNTTASTSVGLDGITQGSGVHLYTEDAAGNPNTTITLNSNAWQTVLIDDTDLNFDDSDSSQSLTGDQSIDGITFTDGSRVEAEYTITVEDPDGNTYTLVAFNINEAGATSYSTVEALAFVGDVGGFPPVGVPLTVIANTESPSILYTELATPPCFTHGCMIETPTGPIAIEELRAGDFVNTVDNGPQPIRWIGQTNLPQAVLLKEEKFRPITIKKDSFGPNQPNQDTQLSPQHRVLVTGWRAELLFGEDEILIPVTKLKNDSTIRVADDIQDVSYFHILFDQHEIVTSNGMMSESYQFNIDSKDGLETRDEVQALFCELPKPSQYQVAARPSVSDKRAYLIHALNLA
jgi:hypothetical protein